MSKLKDIIYFDEQKLISVYSQIEDGLVKSIEGKHQENGKISSELGAGAFGFKAGVGGETNKSIYELTTKTLHHDVLSKVENYLDTNKKVFSDWENCKGLPVDKILENLKKFPYVRATGFATLENYDRINKIIPIFNKTVDFLNKCNETNQPSDEQIREMLKESGQKIQASEIRNYKKKLLNASKVKKIDEWLIKGAGEFLKNYLHNRIDFRLGPYGREKQPILLSSLKQECFFDTDYEKTHFCYGTNPNIKLTILGLITSIPKKEDNEIEEDSDTDTEFVSDAEEFEDAIRGLIRGFEGFDRLTSFGTYPIVKVYPIAIYREI